MKTKRLTTLTMAAALTTALAFGCSSDPSGNDEGIVGGPDAVADAIQDVSVQDTADDVRPVDVAQDQGQPDEGVADIEPSDAAGDTIDDASDATDVPPPPLWEDLAQSAALTVDRFIGVSTHMNQRVGENAARDFEFEKYAELGEVTIREDFHWNTIEAADDAWDMDAVYGQVSQAIENNVTVLPMFGYQVDWAMADTSDYSSIDMAEFGEFVGHVAGEYCDHIKDYEIWNEENIPRFWAPSPDPEAYGNMLKAAHDGIKAACPDARVAFGGISSYDAETDLTDRYGFLERVGNAHPDICDYFDIVAYHPYTFMQYDPPERDVTYDYTLIYQGQSWQTEILRGYLSSIGCPDKAIMITEQGWPSYDLTEDQVGRFLPRSVLLAARDGVEKYIWYTFWDGYPETEGLRPHESYFGLFGWKGDDGTVRRPKPAWNSFKAMADVLRGMKFARDISTALELPNDVYALAFMSDAGDIAVAAWDGREVPDQSWGVDDEGGTDTTFEMRLPLPQGFAVGHVYDIFGVEIDGSGENPGYTVADVDGETVLTTTLSPAIIYIKLVPEA